SGRGRGVAEAERAAVDLLALRLESAAAREGGARRRPDRENPRAGHRKALERMAAEYKKRRDRSRFLRGGHGGAESAARCRDAVDDARYDVGPWLLCSGRTGADRHSVSSESPRIHLGVPAMRSSFRRDLRK